MNLASLVNPPAPVRRAPPPGRAQLVRLQVTLVAQGGWSGLRQALRRVTRARLRTTRS